MNKNQFAFDDAVLKTREVMKNFEDKNIRLSFSGGSDSTISAFFMRECGYNPKLVFFDTGIEYNVTYQYLIEVGKDFELEIVKPRIDVINSCSKYGIPFLSNYITEMIYRLQKHNFQFNKHGSLSYEELLLLYPKSQMAIKWWSNKNSSNKMNIKSDRNLKEFLISKNGFDFRIANKCCEATKKNNYKQYVKDNKIDLLIMGIRKQEYSIKNPVYNSIFYKDNRFNCFKYFPIFWWEDKVKDWYVESRNIKLSDSYTEYGLTRNGCAGCPYSKDLDTALDVLQTKEPILYDQTIKMFEKSYQAKYDYLKYRTSIDELS